MNTTSKSHRAVRSLCEGALMIALAEILSFLPLYKMPWGGAIDLAMLPIFIFCARCCFGPGRLASAAHAVLQTLFEGGIAIGWQSIIGDFLLAYSVLGVAGLVGSRRTELLNTIFGYFTRESGEITLNGKVVENASAFEAACSTSPA